MLTVRRIDMMSKDELLDFCVKNLNDTMCQVLCPGSCEECCMRCGDMLKRYLMTEVDVKKRFLTYNSMEKAYEAFLEHCDSYPECMGCPFNDSTDYDSKCFVRWLDAEIVADNDIST